jgi:hypothetical protein
MPQGPSIHKLIVKLPRSWMEAAKIAIVVEWGNRRQYRQN